MPRYTDDSKERVLDAVDMVALVETRTELRRSGQGQYMGRCPFHDERSPSFSVDAAKKVYHCFGCGVGGDALTFVRETEHLDFVGALESLAGRFGVELELADEDPQAAERRRHRDRLLELLDRTADFYVRWLWEAREAAPARAYLEGRGLGEEVLREFRVGYSPSAWDTLLLASKRQGFSNRELYDAGLAQRSSKGEGRIYDRFRRRIMFPLADSRGRVLGFGARALGADQRPKYLNSSDNEVFHKGDQVFGAHLARAAAGKAGEVIAVEGYTDVLALRQAGLPNVIAIMGTSLTERQIGELGKLAGRVLLALDADSAGQEAMIRAARVAAGRKLELRVVPLPAGLDPADLVAGEGADRARELVARSVPFVRFRVERELAAGDTATAEGKDRIIDALRPVFATLALSALREELIALVAARTDLAVTSVSSWLPLPGEAPAPQPAPAPAPPGVRPAGPGRRDPAALAEEELLALCLATGTAGRELLAGLGPEALTDPLNARAAAHLREHPAAPQDAVAAEDDELQRIVDRLVARAAQGRAGAAALRCQAARVELAQLEGQRGRPGGQADLGMRIQVARRRLDEALAESMEEGREAS